MCLLPENVHALSISHRAYHASRKTASWVASCLAIQRPAVGPEGKNPPCQGVHQQACSTASCEIWVQPANQRAPMPSTASIGLAGCRPQRILPGEMLMQGTSLSGQCSLTQPCRYLHKQRPCLPLLQS